MFAISESLAMKTTSLIPIIIQAPLSFSLSILFIAVFDKIIFKTLTISLRHYKNIFITTTMRE